MESRSGPTLERFARVSKEDVVMAMSRARSTHSVGVDEIPMSVLKRLGDGIAPYVTVLANAVLAGQWWPPSWKQAEVHPLWKKKGSKNDPSTYRPISLLPAIARLVERLIAQQLKAHIRGMLPAFQHGFRAKHSCLTALIQLINQVARARDAGEMVAVASADLAGAFDTVDHEVLIEKLEKRCGLRGSALAFVEGYLEGREQRTVMSGERKSGWRAVPCGVPQGSVLGPLLFALYTLDVGENVQDARIVQYADDMTLVVRLAPEPSKTQLLLSASPKMLKRAAGLALACQMGNHKIPPKQTIKVLGVILDERLSWEQHNAAAAGRAIGAARAVKRACRHIEGAEERAKFYRALSHPHLDYCQAALAAPTEAAVDSLRKAYNRTARMAVRTARSAPARAKLKWPRWERRRAAACAAFVAKVHAEEEPPVLKELFPATLAESQQGMRTRAATRGDLVEPRSHRAVGEKAFSIWAPRVLNQVLNDEVFDDCSSEEDEEQGQGARSEGA
eukprot:gene19384-biopygen18710